MSDTDADRPTRPGLFQVVRKLPFTLTFLAAMIVVAISTGTLLAPASAQPWYETIATGLPALRDGRWWTLLTSPFFVDSPVVLFILLPLLVASLGWAEWQFGALRTASIFLVGHLVGVLGAAGIIALLAAVGNEWAADLAQLSDVGPSCGALAALVCAIATLEAPWRLRARVLVGGWVAIAVLYLGTLHDLEHAVTVAATLFVTVSLPMFRRPSGRPTEREWRLLGFFGVLAVGAIEVLDLIVPYDGPLGQNHPVASFIDVAIDVGVIALIANGIRLGHRIAWLVAFVLGAFNLLGGVVAVALLVLLPDVLELDVPGASFAPLIPPAVLWTTILVVLIAGRGAFRVPLRRSRRIPAARPLTRAGLVERLHRIGGGTISWMATWEDNRRLAVDGGEGAIAYQVHADVAIMLGDPIVTDTARTAALDEFTSAAQQAGLIPCAFSVSAATAAARPDGWRATVVAVDTVVDLPGLEFRGKAWNDVRTAINRAKRESISFRMVRLGEEPWNVLAQVRAISERWAGDKGLPEMRFTLGTVDEALDPEVRVGIAVDAEGSLHGVTSWLPIYGGDGGVIGWTLDLMRRRDGGFGPVMEFLIASSAKTFSEEGYAYISLSGAPLVRPPDGEDGPVEQVLDGIAELIEPLYGFTSLHRFKQKFNPRSEPLYLLYRDEGDLPRIGMALTRAYLPDASLRDLLVTASSVSGTSA